MVWKTDTYQGYSGAKNVENHGQKTSSRIFVLNAELDLPLRQAKVLNQFFGSSNRQVFPVLCSVVSIVEYESTSNGNFHGALVVKVT